MHATYEPEWVFTIVWGKDAPPFFVSTVSASQFSTWWISFFFVSWHEMYEECVLDRVKSCTSSFFFGSIGISFRIVMSRVVLIFTTCFSPWVGCYPFKITMCNTHSKKKEWNPETPSFFFNLFPFTSLMEDQAIWGDEGMPSKPVKSASWGEPNEKVIMRSVCFWGPKWWKKKTFLLVWTRYLDNLNEVTRNLRLAFTISCIGRKGSRNVKKILSTQTMTFWSHFSKFWTLSLNPFILTPSFFSFYPVLVWCFSPKKDLEDHSDYRKHAKKSVPASLKNHQKSSSDIEVIPSSPSSPWNHCWYLANDFHRLKAEWVQALPHHQTFFTKWVIWKQAEDKGYDPPKSTHHALLTVFFIHHRFQAHSNQNNVTGVYGDTSHSGNSWRGIYTTPTFLKRWTSSSASKKQFGMSGGATLLVR